MVGRYLEGDLGQVEQDLQNGRYPYMPWPEACLELKGQAGAAERGRGLQMSSKKPFSWEIKQRDLFLSAAKHAHMVVVLLQICV